MKIVRFKYGKQCDWRSFSWVVEKRMIDGIQTVRIVAVQRRKHRKRRINKKWEKKYGLRYDLYHGEELVERDVKLKVRGTSASRYHSVGFNSSMDTDFSSCTYANPLWKSDYCGG